MDSVSHSSSGKVRMGLTLVEVVCSVAIVGVLMVAAMQMLETSARGGRTIANVQRGPTLAQEMMAEVMQSLYDEPDDAITFGPEPGEVQADSSRSLFDDLDDYNGLSNTPPRARDGSPIPGYDGWTRNVSISFANLSSPSGDAASLDTGVKRITVTVRSPLGQSITLVGLRSMHSRYDQLPGVQTTYITSARVSLQVGPSTTSGTDAAANPLNQIP